MLSTAGALIDACQKAVLDDEQMALASFITHGRQELSQEEFAKAMFMYSTAIASSAIDYATKALLTESQLNELLTSIGELESIKNEVLNGK